MAWMDNPQITQMDADGPVTEYVYLAISLSASICDICGSFKCLVLKKTADNANL